MPRTLALLVYPQFQILDAAGPLSAFETANGFASGSYVLELISRGGGPVTSSCGAALQTRAFQDNETPDTLMVVGGDGVDAASACPATRDFVRQCSTRVRRTTSVCSGAWLLASAGLLEGRQATTHWSRTSRFRRAFPDVRLEADRIYVQDGPIWTAAGISAGIDLALALIADDVGETVARQVARQLVVYYRRPGGQSQFSELAEMQAVGTRFTPLLDHIRQHLDERLDVDALAARVCMSPRHFSRRFTEETGLTPARAVEKLRVEAAAAALESGREAVQKVARDCGFGDQERMRRAFLRILGRPPSALRQKRA